MKIIVIAGNVGKTTLARWIEAGLMHAGFEVAWRHLEAESAIPEVWKQLEQEGCDYGIVETTDPDAQAELEVYAEKHAVFQVIDLWTARPELCSPLRLPGEEGPLPSRAS